MLDAAPWELRIVGASKGLIYGDMRIEFNSRETLSCSTPGGKN